MKQGRVAQRGSDTRPTLVRTPHFVTSSHLPRIDLCRTEQFLLKSVNQISDLVSTGKVMENLRMSSDDVNVLLSPFSLRAFASAAWWIWGDGLLFEVRRQLSASFL